MEISEIRNLLTEMQERSQVSGGLFDLDQLEEDIAEAEAKWLNLVLG